MAPIRMLSVKLGHWKRAKDILILLHKNIHAHNQMLLEALLLRGKDSPQFEHVGPDATVVKMVEEAIYKEFYR